MAQLIVFATLAGALVLFMTNVWRYDLVALLALLLLTVVGIVPPQEAFLGFGNPAVVTVAAVLVISRALENAGLVTIIGNWVSKVGDNPTLQVTALTALVTVLSAFINNVGALALLMPVAIEMARKHQRSPSFLLMPMAFGALLGGMTTLIGTPPNLIISDFRRDHWGVPFRMFDYSFVGVPVTIVGIFFISLVGWRLVPIRRSQASRQNLFRIDNYLSEVVVGEGSDLIGRSIQSFSGDDRDVVIAGLFRDGKQVGQLGHFLPLRAGDDLIVRAESKSLSEFVRRHKLELKVHRPLSQELKSDETMLVEAVVPRYSLAERRTPRGLRLRRRFGVNLLGIARQGEPIDRSLRDLPLQSGDILLLQMPVESRWETLENLGLLPLAERRIKIGEPRRLLVVLGIFLTALLVSALGIFPSSVSFCGAVAALLICSAIRFQEAYESIDWSIIILLGAMIPVGQALEATGGADTVAKWLLFVTPSLAPAMILGVVMVVTTLLSNVINNAAAAIVMAPVAISIASGIEASPEPFLLGTAIAASSAFLTPIGHQCNTLVLGPGGYSFGDYWRLGTVVTIIVIAVSVPMLTYFWPL